VDQSYQIEPSDVAGFIQSFRSIIPESVSAESPGAEFETWGISLEEKLPTRTYLALDGQLLNSKAPQIAGAFDVNSSVSSQAIASGIGENVDYHEKSLQLTGYQLLGEGWSIGTQYRITESSLFNDFPGVPASALLINFQASQRTEATLQQAELFAIYNDPRGFFFRAEALWNGQNSAGYTPSLASDDFWQLNAYIGYRFLHRRLELRAGLLNILNQDYNLNPLNPHEEFPHERTFAFRLRANF
jgi:hypothetical protein